MSNKQDDESPEAAAAFLEFCAMGPGRSLEGLARLRLESGSRGTHRVPTLKAWSSRYNWQERVKIYDQQQTAKLAEEAAKRRLDAIERMNERHALIGTSQQQKALEILKKAAEQEEIDAKTAVTLLKLAVDIERHARGDAETTRLEITGKDGGPVKTDGTVAIYLPEKDDLQ